MSEGTMMLLPPAAHLCQTCGSEHEDYLPHNAQSLYYQVAFRMQHGRSASWLDAMAHCADDVKAIWRELLIGCGVDVDAGEVNPPKKGSARR